MKSQKETFAVLLTLNRSCIGSSVGIDGVAGGGGGFGSGGCDSCGGCSSCGGSG